MNKMTDANRIINRESVARPAPIGLSVSTKLLPNSVVCTSYNATRAIWLTVTALISGNALCAVPFVGSR